jgi:hypothetical protein
MFTPQTIRLFFSYIFILCAPNVPFWIASNIIFLNRPFFNLDTTLSLILFVFNKWIGLVVLLISLIIDCLVSQSFTYRFSSPIDFFNSIRFIDKLDLQSIVTYTNFFYFITLIIFLIFVYFISRKTANKRSSALYLFTLGSFLIFTDTVNGASDIWHRNELIIPVNIAGSPSFTFLSSVLNATEKHELHKIDNDESILRRFDIESWASVNPSRSILFIIVESLGVPRSKEALNYLQDAAYNSNSYTTNFYEIQFKGATTNGELRSLCGLQGSYTRLTSISASDCLPYKLGKLGWKTTGFHGFSSRLFDRESWWPTVGLSNSFFIDDLTIKNLPRCGNIFSGTCDKDLLERAISLTQAPKSFSYVLTLNTHLPVLPVRIPDELVNICSKHNIPNAACMHISSLKDLVSFAVKGASKMDTKPLLIIVGDHAPPFSTIKDRDAFTSNLVPAFVLVP